MKNQKVNQKEKFSAARKLFEQLGLQDHEISEIEQVLGRMKVRKEQVDEHKIIRAFFPCEIHKPESRQEDGEEDSRVRIFTISTERRDRHGTVIRIPAWQLDDYNNNGVVCYQHLSGGWMPSENNPDFILGPGKSYIKGKNLVGEVKFETADINPLADKILKKVDYGTLKATSVGFLPAKGHWGLEEDGEDTGTYYFDSVTLVEFSIVTIPSNPDALIMQKAMAPLRNYLDNTLKEETNDLNPNIDPQKYMRMYHNRYRRIAL